MANDKLESRLKETYKYFYPDADFPGFQPDVVDYFSMLRTFLDVGANLPGSLTGIPDLNRMLKLGIVHMMLSKSRSIDWTAFENNAYLGEMVQPGNIIVTSNWDTLIERFAARKGIPLRRSILDRQFSTSEVTLLKLHGSIDWCRVDARRAGLPDEDFSDLAELQNSARKSVRPLPTDDEQLLLIRSGLGDTWELLRDHMREPWVVTMVTGKSDDLGPLRKVWNASYRAVSAAKKLEIVGYSMPPDDVEVRTMLRAGIRRGELPEVHVRNPSPDVHARVRTYLARDATSDFMAVSL